MHWLGSYCVGESLLLAVAVKETPALKEHMLLVEFQFSLSPFPTLIFITEASAHIYVTLFSLISFTFLIKSLMISLYYKFGMLY